MRNPDHTEGIRRVFAKVINEAAPTEREKVEELHGKVWDTKELQEEFKVLGFMAPYVVVERKADSKKGTLTFQHAPRFYFGFQPD